MFLEPTWMEQPWREIPKTFHDRVTDCLTHAPAILKRVRSLFALDITHQINMLHELINECWQLDEVLDVIDDEMRRSALDELYWPVPSHEAHIINTENSENLFPVVFCFPNVQTAATMMLLWATRTMLWSGLTNMYHYLGVIKPLESSSLVDHNLETARGLSPEGTRAHRCGEYLSTAHRVCQSLEYFLKDEMLLAGALSVSPSLGIVADSLQNRPGHDREITWIQAALGAVRQKGLRVLEHVKL